MFVLLLILGLSYPARYRNIAMKHCRKRVHKMDGMSYADGRSSLFMLRVLFVSSESCSRFRNLRSRHADFAASVVGNASCDIGGGRRQPETHAITCILSITGECMDVLLFLIPFTPELFTCGTSTALLCGYKLALL